MRLAVRFALQHLCTAEEEVSSGGIPDRPAAVMAGQFEERATLRERDVCILAGIVDVGLGFDHPDRTPPLLAWTNPAEGAFNRPVEGVTPVFGPSSPAARPCIRRKFSDPESMNFPKHCAFGDAAAPVRERSVARWRPVTIALSRIRYAHLSTATGHIGASPAGVGPIYPCRASYQCVVRAELLTTFRINMSTTKCSRAAGIVVT